MATLLLALIYLCFISLGLPDSLLGSAWPVLHAELNVPVSYAGIISMIIFAGSALSSFFSGKLLYKFGAHKVTFVSVSMTALALFGFSVSTKFWMLILFSIPYGLGAGGVDAILNNYVAIHYKPQHMSWLHCMWGIGASVSPCIMSFALLHFEWNSGYLTVAIIQTVLAAVIFISLPIWKKGSSDAEENAEIKQKPVGFKDLFKTSGAISFLVVSFCYCAMELTTSLWASTYLVEKWDFSPESAAGYASMFYIGMTAGRFINGFLTMKLKDRTVIRGGVSIVLLGIILLLLPYHSIFALTGFIVIGLGSAPIYPCLIHMIPEVFGKDKSQTMVGIQMACAYIGFLIMPTVFGIIAERTTISLLPFYQFALLLIMVVLHETVIKKTQKKD